MFGAGERSQWQAGRLFLLHFFHFTAFFNAVRTRTLRAFNTGFHFCPFPTEISPDDQNLLIISCTVEYYVFDNIRVFTILH